MKFTVTLILFLLVSNFSYSQQNEVKSKAFYFSAQDAFQANNYDDALSLLEKSEEAGGASNAYLEALKAKCYAGKKDWINTKKTLELCYNYNPGNDILKDLSPIILKADTEYEKAIKEEQDRILAEQQAQMVLFKQQQEAQMAAIQAEQKRLEKANEHYNEAYKVLETFKGLKEGAPYLINTKPVTGLASEKSIFIFYGDEYIIYTIPNIGYVKSLFKDNIAFDPEVGDDNMQRLVKHKNSSGRKTTDYFKLGTTYNDVFFGKKGLLWAGKQYTTFNKNLYYYYYNFNSTIDLYCNVDLKEDIGVYLIPYIKTGKIIKQVNYDYIIDENLKSDFKSQGFTQISKKEPIEIISAERESFSMLFPRKDATYVLVDDNAKDKNSSQKYLYFEEKDVKMNYGLMNYRSFQKNAQSELLKNIIGINPDYQMSRKDFNSIFKGANDTSGSVMQYFTSESYTLPFEIIPKIYGYFEPIDLTKL